MKLPFLINLIRDIIEVAVIDHGYNLSKKQILRIAENLVSHWVNSGTLDQLLDDEDEDDEYDDDEEN